MLLAEKGRQAPPPRLEPAAQRVAEAIAQWPNVNARSHWLLGDERVVDGADFYLGDDELGHIHLDSEAHVACSLAVADRLVEAKLARRFEWSRKFVVFDIRRQSEVEHALWLFRLSYDRRSGLAEAAILARISAYARASA